jgi:flagellar hook-associated protein 3 FlgL
MMTNTQIKSLQRGLTDIDSSYRKISSGTKYERVSDDPVEVAKIMQLKADMKNSEKYASNIDDAIGWLDVSESSLQEVVNTMHRFKELMVTAAGNGDEAGAITAEVHQLLDQIGHMMNTSYDGRYVFSGQQTGTLPITVNYDGNGNAISMTYNGDNAEYSTEVEKGVNTVFSINGNEILGDIDPGAGVTTLSDTFNAALTALQANDKTAAGAVLDDIDDHVDHLLSTMGKVGARTRRMELAQDNHEKLNLNMTELLSKLQDTDISEEIINLTSFQQIYEANIAAAEKIMNLSLMNFLR